MKALKIFLRIWGFLLGMVLTFAAMPVGDCRGQISNDICSAFIDEAENRDYTTFVIGHTHPDSDTVCSAIAYANFKQHFNVKCEPRVAGTINKETEFILNYFDVEAPPVLENLAGHNVILVDHNVNSQTTDGIIDANVLEIIDHHNLYGDIKNANPIFYLNMPVGSTSTIVWWCYVKNNIAIDKKMAGLMFSAILSDTDNLRSENTTNLDRQAVESLQKIAEIYDRDKFFLAMEKDFTDYSKMTEREIIFTDFKNFSAGDMKCGYSTVATLTPSDRNFLKVRLNEYMKKFFDNREFDMFFIKIHDIETYTAEMLAFGENAKEILSAALEKKNENFILNPNIPNKKIARAIEAATKEFSPVNTDFAA